MDSATTTTDVAVTTDSKPWHQSIDWGGGEGFAVPEKVQEFKSPAELAKAYENARTKIQSKGILIPKDGEDRSGFEAELKKHLGLTVPEKPDEYGWKPPEEVKDFYPNLTERMAELHAKGIDKTTAKHILDAEAEGIARAKTVIQEAQAELAKGSKAQLQKEWGDDYEKRMEAVSKQAERYPEAYELLKSTGLANSAPILKMMDEVSRSVREAAPEQGSAVQRQGAADRIKSIRAEMANMRPNHPDRSKLQQELAEQYKIVAKNS